MSVLSYFSIKLPVYLTYMIQQVEYDPRKFMAWLKRRPSLYQVMHRQKLVTTKKAAALIYFQYLVILLYLTIIGIFAARESASIFFLVILTPLISILSLVLAVYGGAVISRPINSLAIRRSRTLLQRHPGIKVAILGSYGKTTMKELLLTVLGEAKEVKATPGNKNVPISHARWASTLSGHEDILLIEFGEAKPGDIARFCRNTSPDIAIVTGIAPNHLDGYETLDSLADDLASVAGFVAETNIYVNSESKLLFAPNRLDPKKINKYGQEGIGKTRIDNVKLDIKGMYFSAGGVKMHTNLIGKHLLGPLALCINLAGEQGLTKTQISAAINKTKPFEHRLQPKEINGAWIIDDTYNGSLEGFLAGLRLLKELNAKRKIYVTPGLVDQGQESRRVHHEIGAAIAQAKPDKVILMKNSTTEYIKSSLEERGYTGELEIREDPLEFYSNLEHYLAAGDVWMLQNDWPDAYK